MHHERERGVRRVVGATGSLGIGVILAGSVTLAADVSSHGGLRLAQNAALANLTASEELSPDTPDSAFPIVAEVGEGLNSSPRRGRFGRRRLVREIPPPPIRAPGEPPRIALQAGHWLAMEVPEELDGIRYNGTEGGGTAEWEVTLEIARLTASILEENGYVVDVLPSTIPPLYYADAFISLHADGHDDPAVSGFTVAAPRRDGSGMADAFAEIVGEVYQEATSLRRRTYITRRMTGYYAFNSRRYEHALHPETPGVILETGFLTSPNDRGIIVDRQGVSAQGIADAVMRFVPPAPAPAVAQATPE